MRQILYFIVNIQTMLLIIQPAFLMAEPLRGHNIQPAKIPFVASIALKHPTITTKRAHFCSGSLIASNLVLTAAHCLAKYNYKQILVVIGAADLKGVKSHRYKVKSWMSFEQWAAEKDLRLLRLEDNDIALIRLKSHVTGITPANISTLRIKDLYGKNATLVGWDNEPDGRTRYLRQAKVKILTAMNCKLRTEIITNMIVHIPEGHFCTAADLFVLSTDSDSGGPVLDENSNILGVTEGFCPENATYCSENYADTRRVNLHVDLLDEYRQFIEDVKSIYDCQFNALARAKIQDSI